MDQDHPESCSSPAVPLNGKRRGHWPPRWTMRRGIAIGILVAGAGAAWMQQRTAVPPTAGQSSFVPQAIASAPDVVANLQVGTRKPRATGVAVEASRRIDLVSALRNGRIPLESLLEQAERDGAFREELRQRYLATLDPELRALLLQLLERAPTVEQLEFAELLLADADPQRRADGYRLLSSLPLDDQMVRARVLRGLHEESDPAALSALVSGMHPGLLAAEDAGPIGAELMGLVLHPDPRVRAGVLPQLPAWAGAAQLEGPCFDALVDRDPGVRAAAIAAIGVSGVRSPRLLDALFSLAANRDEAAEHRHNALQALMGFSLSRAEVDLYRLLQADVPLHPGRG